ncbi:MAG: 4Fe-4S dicluster domain-containing protein [Spirochaetes bacterium]|nr:4Fe-4S dicluster domain-containing protein [Spirochaetota bacterium]
MLTINASGELAKNTWRELDPAGAICEGGTAAQVNTGDWRINIPAWIADKCTHCMLCVPTCPDSSIPVKGGKRQDFDFMHCKGCGVCIKVCPLKAMTIAKEDK